MINDNLCPQYLREDKSNEIKSSLEKRLEEIKSPEKKKELLSNIYNILIQNEEIKYLMPNEISVYEHIFRKEGLNEEAYTVGIHPNYVENNMILRMINKGGVNGYSLDTYKKLMGLAVDRKFIDSINVPNIELRFADREKEKASSGIYFSLDFLLDLKNQGRIDYVAPGSPLKSLR